MEARRDFENYRLNHFRLWVLLIKDVGKINAYTNKFILVKIHKICIYETYAKKIGYMRMVDALGY